MRINIVLNNELVKEAFFYAPVSTKQELIEFVLQEFVKNHRRRRDVSELRGKIQICPDYIYKKFRENKIAE